MSELLSIPPALLWSAIGVLAACVVIARMWDRVKWWWLNTWYSFPLIGPIARASASDRKLCADYKKFIRLRSRHDYEEKVTYLSKAGDTGRSNTPLFIWLLTIALVFVEAMGFSYVLAGYTIPGASENTQQLGALGIAFIVSVLLVGFTHFAGHELYVSGKLRMARRSWADEKRKYKLFTGDVPLSKDQSQDDDQPWYTQMVNRNAYGAHARYWVSIATMVLVLVVAVGSTYVRGKVLDKQLHDDVSAGPSLQWGGAAPALNLDALVLPDADQAQVDAAKDKVLQDGKHIDESAGWGTFIVLAFIFVFLQVLGVLFGYKWGFAGAESKKAFKDIGGGRYSSYEDVYDFYRSIADTAQAKLEGLQNSRSNRASHSGTSADTGQALTFEQFMQQEREAESRDRADEAMHASKRRQPARAQPLEATPAASEDDELARLEQELQAKREAKRQQAEIEAEAQRQRDIEAQKAREAAAQAEPESADDELARLEKELEAKRQAKLKQEKIEAMKRELQALESENKP